jgi:hypothetical protein
MGRVGVQVFKPEKFTASDLAAEFLHVDPKANAARDALRKSMTPEQLQRLKRESADYSESIRMGQPEIGRSRMRSTAPCAATPPTNGRKRPTTRWAIAPSSVRSSMG